MLENWWLCGNHKNFGGLWSKRSCYMREKETIKRETKDTDWYTERSNSAHALKQPTDTHCTPPWHVGEGVHHRPGCFGSSWAAPSPAPSPLSSRTLLALTPPLTDLWSTRMHYTASLCHMVYWTGEAISVLMHDSYSFKNHYTLSSS